MFVAAEGHVAHPGDDHVAGVEPAVRTGGVQIGQDEAVAAVRQHEAVRRPLFDAVGVEALQHGVGILHPGDDHVAVVGAGDARRGEKAGGRSRDRDPRSTPQGHTIGGDLRRHDALGRRSVVVEGEQGVAGGVHGQTVVGRRRQAPVGDQDTVVRPDLGAGGGEPLQAHVVTAGRVVEPADVEAAVGARHDLRLHLLAGAVGEHQIVRRIVRPDGPHRRDRESQGEQRDREKTNGSVETRARNHFEPPTEPP